MKRYIRLLAILPLVLVLIVSDSYGAGFIKFDGIEGECKDKDHQGWCDLDSWSYGVGRSIHKATGLHTGTRHHGPIKITKRVDKASPLLLELVTQDPYIRQVTIDAARTLPDGRTFVYYKFEMRDCIISSYNLSMDEDTGDLVEEVTFTFGKIIWTWEDGGITAEDDWAQ